MKARNEYIYLAHVIKIIDGDTVDMMVDLGFKAFVDIRFRLARIDTKEMNSKDLTEKMLAIAAKTELETVILDKTVKIQTSKTDKYGRYVAEIWTEDGKNISDYLLEKQLAKPYQ